MNKNEQEYTVEVCVFFYIVKSVVLVHLNNIKKKIKLVPCNVLHFLACFWWCVYPALIENKYMMLGCLYWSIAEPHLSSIQNRSKNEFLL